MWVKFDPLFLTCAWYDPETVFEVIAEYEDDDIPGGYAYDIRHPDGTILHKVDGFRLTEVNAAVSLD